MSKPRWRREHRVPLDPGWFYADYIELAGSGKRSKFVEAKRTRQPRPRGEPHAQATHVARMYKRAVFERRPLGSALAS